MMEKKAWKKKACRTGRNLRGLGVAAGIMLTLLPAGCKNGKTSGERDYGLDKDAPVTITAWHYYNGIQQIKFDELVREFNDTEGLERGIVLQAFSKSGVDELADSVDAAVNKKLGAEEPPDIFACYSDSAYALDKSGVLADLSRYFTEAELSEYIDAYIDEGRFDGSALKIFPIAKSSEVMIVNKTDWQKFADATGVTLDELSTWESLVEVSARYYDYTDALTPDIPNDGRAFFGRDALANYLLVGARQLGCTLVSVDADGVAVPALEKEVVRRLWDNYYVPYVKGYFTSEGRYRSDDAKIGRLIALVGSTSGASYYPDQVTLYDEYTYPIENVVLPVPNFEGTEPFVVQQGAGMAVLSSDEKTEYACAVFLKWFTETERNIEFSVGSGYLPVKKEANDFERIRERTDGQDGDIDGTIYNAIRVAMDQVASYELYTSAPYQNSSGLRSEFAGLVESGAGNARRAVMERIAAGEERESVLAQYTGDAAFEVWYKQLEELFIRVLADGVK